MTDAVSYDLNTSYLHHSTHYSCALEDKLQTWQPLDIDKQYHSPPLSFSRPFHPPYLAYSKLRNESGVGQTGNMVAPDSSPTERVRLF
ncbi:hypothetical protein PFLUV_G00049240 [Perca fluviatilis]|uniref:Uncharacterized protein n=1 Tax=Perca fluviatilis TaxID=8168 RepID=A0A6A5FDC7_PERFL|nr:hypothetical protein PFLUV_G00049240 [Perca fluviatilis]